MAWVEIVTVLALLQFIAFGLFVARARVRFGIAAPATSGHEHFERYMRVHLNTVEVLVVFLPALWLFARSVDPHWAAGLGAVYLVGRLVYFRSYVRDPRSRSLGFGLSMLPAIVMLLGVLFVALRSLLAGPHLPVAAQTTPALAAPAAPAAAPVDDRAAIENMLVDYYAQLGSGRHDFGAYFAADGKIDVDGQVAQGQEAIEKLYASFASESPPEPGTFRMLLSNVRIAVDGDKATADVMWTGLHSASVTELPRVVEQGREHDELVRLDGRWKFSNRVITSDGGMDKRLLKSYVKR